MALTISKKTAGDGGSGRIYVPGETQTALGGGDVNAPKKNIVSQRTIQRDGRDILVRTWSDGTTDELDQGATGGSNVATGAVQTATGPTSPKTETTKPVTPTATTVNPTSVVPTVSTAPTHDAQGYSLSTGFNSRGFNRLGLGLTEQRDLDASNNRANAEFQRQMASGQFNAGAIRVSAGTSRGQDHGERYAAGLRAQITAEVQRRAKVESDRVAAEEAANTAQIREKNVSRRSSINPTFVLGINDQEWSQNFSQMAGGRSKEQWMADTVYWDDAQWNAMFVSNPALMHHFQRANNLGDDFRFNLTTGMDDGSVDFRDHRARDADGDGVINAQNGLNNPFGPPAFSSGKVVNADGTVSSAPEGTFGGQTLSEANAVPADGVRGKVVNDGAVVTRYQVYSISGGGGPPKFGVVPAGTPIPFGATDYGQKGVNDTVNIMGNEVAVGTLNGVDPAALTADGGSIDTSTLPPGTATGAPLVAVKEGAGPGSGTSFTTDNTPNTQNAVDTTTVTNQPVFADGGSIANYAIPVGTATGAPLIVPNEDPRVVHLRSLGIEVSGDPQDFVTTNDPNTQLKVLGGKPPIAIDVTTGAIVKLDPKDFVADNADMIAEYNRDADIAQGQLDFQAREADSVGGPNPTERTNLQLAAAAAASKLEQGAAADSADVTRERTLTKTQKPQVDQLIDFLRGNGGKLGLPGQNVVNLSDMVLPNGASYADLTPENQQAVMDWMMSDEALKLRVSARAKRESSAGAVQGSTAEGDQTPGPDPIGNNVLIMQKLGTRFQGFEFEANLQAFLQEFNDSAFDGNMGTIDEQIESFFQSKVKLGQEKVERDRVQGLFTSSFGFAGLESANMLELLDLFTLAYDGNPETVQTQIDDFIRSRVKVKNRATKFDAYKKQLLDDPDFPLNFDQIFSGDPELGHLLSGFLNSEEYNTAAAGAGLGGGGDTQPGDAGGDPLAGGPDDPESPYYQPPLAGGPDDPDSPYYQPPKTEIVDPFLPGGPDDPSSTYYQPPPSGTPNQADAVSRKPMPIGSAMYEVLTFADGSEWIYNPLDGTMEPNYQFSIGPPIDEGGPRLTPADGQGKDGPPPGVKGGTPGDNVPPPLDGDGKPIDTGQGSDGPPPGTPGGTPGDNVPPPLDEDGNPIPPEEAVDPPFLPGGPDDPESPYYQPPGEEPPVAEPDPVVKEGILKDLVDELQLVIKDLGFDGEDYQETQSAAIEAKFQQARERLGRQFAIDPGGSKSGAAQRQFELLEAQQIQELAGLQADVTDRVERGMAAQLQGLTEVFRTVATTDLEQQRIEQNNSQFQDTLAVQLRELGLNEVQVLAAVKKINSEISNNTRRTSADIGQAWSDITGQVGTQSGTVSATDLGIDITNEDISSAFLGGSSPGKEILRQSFAAMMGRDPTDQELQTMLGGGTVNVDSMPTLESRKFASTITQQNMERVAKYDSIADSLGLDRDKFTEVQETNDRNWAMVTGQVASQFGLSQRTFTEAQYELDSRNNTLFFDDTLSPAEKTAKMAENMAAIAQQYFPSNQANFREASSLFSRSIGNQQNEVARGLGIDAETFADAQRQVQQAEDRMLGVWGSLISNQATENEEVSDAQYLSQEYGSFIMHDIYTPLQTALPEGLGPGFEDAAVDALFQPENEDKLEKIRSRYEVMFPGKVFPDAQLRVNLIRAAMAFTREVNPATDAKGVGERHLPREVDYVPADWISKLSKEERASVLSLIGGSAQTGSAERQGSTLLGSLGRMAAIAGGAALGAQVGGPAGALKGAQAASVIVG